MLFFDQLGIILYLILSFSSIKNLQQENYLTEKSEKNEKIPHLQQIDNNTETNRSSYFFNPFIELGILNSGIGFDTINIVISDFAVAGLKVRAMYGYDLNYVGKTIVFSINTYVGVF